MFLKQLFPVLLMLITFQKIDAQQSIQLVKYLCATEIGKGSMHEGLNSLYFTTKKSLYVHDEWPEENKYISVGGATIFIKGDKEGMSIYRNSRTDSMIWKTGYGAIKKSYIIKDTIPKMKWNIIEDQSKVMSGLHCIKAIGAFGGRQYTVWYTPDIEVSFGPYKLGGLPGLILQAASDDGRVEYIFHSFEQEYKGNVIVDKPQDGIIVTIEELRDLRIQSLLEIEAKTDATHNDPPPDYEIEKNKWTIFSTYKRKRAKQEK